MKTYSYKRVLFVGVALTKLTTSRTIYKRFAVSYKPPFSPASTLSRFLPLGG
ncbi:MAG: hypothetical protein QM660_08965 [Dysgonomonas sp.]